MLLMMHVRAQKLTETPGGDVPNFALQESLIALNQGHSL